MTYERASLGRGRTRCDGVTRAAPHLLARTLLPRRRPRDQRGAAAVEFALVLVPLLFIVFGLIQYGWYFYAMQAGTSATTDVARRLSVGDCQDPAALSVRLSERLGSASASASSDDVAATVTYTDVTIGNPATVAPGVVGGDVTVTVEFPTHDFAFPFVPLPDGGTVTRTATARVEDTVASVSGC